MELENLFCLILNNNQQSVVLLMTLNEKQENVISNTIKFVKTTLLNAEGGHDWWHIYRVWKLSIQIAQEENVDLFIVQLGALLHDIADSKFNDGDEDVGPEIAKKFLVSQHVDKNILERIDLVIRYISFKNSFGKAPEISSELAVIQDADRLDAIGAIGIARTFNYGGHKNFSIYDPSQKPRQYDSKEAYKKSDSPTINHFYEKLFLLKDMMNTKTGKKLAVGRHQFMELYLEQFYEEWEGKR